MTSLKLWLVGLLTGRWGTLPSSLNQSFSKYYWVAWNSWRVHQWFAQHVFQSSLWWRPCRTLENIMLLLVISTRLISTMLYYASLYDSTHHHEIINLSTNSDFVSSLPPQIVRRCNVLSVELKLSFSNSIGVKLNFIIFFKFFWEAELFDLLQNFDCGFVVLDHFVTPDFIFNMLVHCWE